MNDLEMNTNGANDAGSEGDEHFKPGELKHISIGFEFAAAVVVLALAGYFVDRQWNTSPLGILVGSFSGIAVGMYVVIKAALKIQSDEDKRSED